MERSFSSSKVVELRVKDIVSIRTYLTKDLTKGMSVYFKDKKVVEVLAEARDRVFEFLAAKEQSILEKEKKSTLSRVPEDQETDSERAFRLENELSDLNSQVNLLLNKLGKNSIEEALE